MVKKEKKKQKNKKAEEPTEDDMFGRPEAEPSALMRKVAATPVIPRLEQT